MFDDFVVILADDQIESIFANTFFASLPSTKIDFLVFENREKYI